MFSKCLTRRDQVQQFRESKKEWCRNTGGQGRMECYNLQGWGSRSSLPNSICEGFNMVRTTHTTPITPHIDMVCVGACEAFTQAYACACVVCALFMVPGDRLCKDPLESPCRV
jgi:hypothetical protein